MPSTRVTSEQIGDNVELLERADQLATLSWAFEQVAGNGAGRLVFLGGEAGVGKTALLRRFCAEHAGRAHVLWGSCERLFTPRARGPFLDIAERWPGPLAAGVQERVKPHEFVTMLIAELRLEPPTMLVLEDLHWIDEGTFDVLRLVVERLPDAPVLILASFRDDALSAHHLLRLLLGEIATVPSVERLHLQPLSRVAVATLARPFGVDEVELYAKTAGNPFFVTEVLAGGGARIPATVRDAVLARASYLPPAGRHILEAAAVVPARVELWLLEELVGGDLAGLESCISSGMLHTEDQTIAFRHELARLAIEAATALHRRVELHRAVVRALASPPIGRPDPARLAHHAEAAFDPRAVLEHAPVAGDYAAELGAHVEAAAQYARALRFADSLRMAEQANLYERHAYECHLTDDLISGLASNAAALERRRALGHDVLAADVLRLRAKMLWFVGQPDEAETICRDAVTLLEGSGDTRRLATAYATMTQIAMLAMKREMTLEWGHKTIELAEQVDAAGLVASALTSIGTVEAFTGATEGYTRLERGLALAKDAAEDEHIARALVNLVSSAVYAHRHELAEQYLTEGLAYTEHRDLESFRGVLMGLSALLQLSRGHISEAADDASAILRRARTLPMIRIGALVVLGRALARRGDLDAWTPLDEARDLTPTTDFAMFGSVALARAEAAWLLKTPDAIDAETDVAYEIACERDVVWYREELAYYRTQAGIDDAAAVRGRTPFALQLRGQSGAAARAWTALECPYEAALALSECDDVTELRAALRQLQRLEAGPAARRVARQLRELGVAHVSRGPRRATLANPGNLTVRELEVLACLNDGLSNAAIATRLYISPKTADHHVSAIMGKLGVHKRSDAVLEARRRGLGELGDPTPGARLRR